jgi:hypothetical protein
MTAGIMSAATQQTYKSAMAQAEMVERFTAIFKRSPRISRAQGEPQAARDVIDVWTMRTRQLQNGLRAVWAQAEEAPEWLRGSAAAASDSEALAGAADDSETSGELLTPDRFFDSVRMQCQTAANLRCSLTLW